MCRTRNAGLTCGATKPGAEGGRPHRPAISADNEGQLARGPGIERGLQLRCDRNVVRRVGFLAADHEHRNEGTVLVAHHLGMRTADTHRVAGAQAGPIEQIESEPLPRSDWPTRLEFLAPFLEPWRMTIGFLLGRAR
jgi:hypothetical protein